MDLSVSDCAVRPRSGRENVAETCAPSPDANLRLTNLRLGNARSWRRVAIPPRGLSGPKPERPL